MSLDNLTASLGIGTKLSGNIEFQGPSEINGEVEGEINAKDKLLIGKSAEIKANINGTEIVIEGTVSGDISASTNLTLKQPAKITGNISAAKLSIEEGVIFEGNCSMKSSSTSTLKPVKNSEKLEASA